MDRLKEGIGLRGYGQHHPLIEYKREAYEMFEGLTSRIKEGVSEFIFKVEIVREPSLERVLVGSPQVPQPALAGAGEREKASNFNQVQTRHVPYRRKKLKIRRNEPCPCGSGKKYKYCCGGKE